jgi:hypothetical protein
LTDSASFVTRFRFDAPVFVGWIAEASVMVDFVAAAKSVLDD